MFCRLPRFPFTLGRGKLLLDPVDVIRLALVQKGPDHDSDLLIMLHDMAELQLGSRAGICRDGLLLEAILEVMRRAVDLGEKQFRD